MLYSEELTKAMTWLGQQPDTLFIGQNIIWGGNAIYATLEGVPVERRVELPVAEEMQMGMSLGLALTGKTVISIYPRFDFLLLATNQLVNHLDKLEKLAHEEFHAKVIIRVGIGATRPLHPGVQHCGDYTEAFRLMLKMPVASLLYPSQIFPTFQHAYASCGSCLIVEDLNRYGME